MKKPRVVSPEQKENMAAGRRRAAETRAQRPGQQRLLTASEAGEYLSLAEATVRQWASMGRIPKVTLGAALRFDIRELERIVERNTIPVAPILKGGNS